MPYKERLNAGIVTAALGLEDNVRAVDFSGALKASTGALISALESVESKRTNNLLVCTAETRLGKPAGPQEMIFGDAAAALLVSDKDVIAEFKGSYTVTYDFVDHYRGATAKYDRQWEDRWIRDLGFEKLVPEAVTGLMKKLGMKPTDFAKVVYPCHYAPARASLNKKLGIGQGVEQPNLLDQVGDAGTAQCLVMFVNALEQSKPGDKILLVSWGSGCDALCFEVTDKIGKMKGRDGIAGSLAKKAPLDNYTKYLVWRDILPAEPGMRGEEDLWTRWSSQWRARKLVFGLWGSKCKNCGTATLPPQRVCVNPDCEAVDQMELIRYSDKMGKIATYTGDMLAASYNPPAIYGAVVFDEGGKYYFDFTDCDLDKVATGMSVRMTFRRKYYDPKRDISGYFWKAVPIVKEG